MSSTPLSGGPYSLTRAHGVSAMAIWNEGFERLEFEGKADGPSPGKPQIRNRHSTLIALSIGGGAGGQRPPAPPPKDVFSPLPTALWAVGRGEKGGGAMAFRTGFSSSNPQSITGQSTNALTRYELGIWRAEARRKGGENIFRRPGAGLETRGP